MMKFLYSNIAVIYICISGALAITDEEALERARAVLQSVPLIDGHNDLAHVYRGRVHNRVDTIDLRTNVDDQWGPSHTDIPRLRQGLVGGQFWAAYVSCTKRNKDAVRANLEQLDVIHRFVDKYSTDFEFVTTAQGIEDAFARGKIGSLIGIEGAHVFDSSLAALRMSYELGARYLTLTHACDLPWVFSSAIDKDDVIGRPDHTGLSAWGRTFIREMNRLGMIIDLSHVSKQTMIDAIDASDAPVIFSHSNAWTLCEHTRNVQNDVLLQMAAKGGMVMITFVPIFVACPPLAETSAEANLAHIADHIDYVKNFVGADYVGIGGDFDGTESLPEGLEDVSRYPYLFAELVQRGWTDEELAKLAGNNMLRVFREVESVRDSMTSIKPLDDLIPDEDLDPANPCRT